jgi:hypothetical protein
MKLNFLILLSLLVLIGIANGTLYCFSCTGCGPDGSYNSTECPVGTDTCMSTKLNYPGGSLVMKSCVPSAACKATGFGLGSFGFWIGCCTTDNCNSASSLAPKWMPLFASLSIFFGLFKFKN